MHSEQPLHGRNCYNPWVCVCCKCVRPIKAIKSSANRPPCCILIRLGVQHRATGQPHQTTLTPASTSPTNANQNHGINTLHHLAPPQSTHTHTLDANTSLTVWQILPSIQNEWGKDRKKKKKKNQRLIRKIKTSQSPEGEREGGGNKKWKRRERKRLERRQIITAVTQFGSSARDSFLHLSLSLSFRPGSLVFFFPTNQ